MCNKYPRLISSCSSGSELYALSRHRCCCSFPLPDLGSYDDGRRCLITMLSTIFVSSLMSWVLAEDMITDSGNSFCICQNVPFCSQFASVCGIATGHRPPRATLWIWNRDFHVQLIPTILSQIFSNLLHVFLKTPKPAHCWNLL